MAIPLAEAGFDVVGLDLDAGMLARAAARAAGTGRAAARRLTLLEGDLLEAGANEAVVARGPYRLVFIALNSILLLATADAQRRAFVQIGALLGPGGVAVVDAWQPTPADLVAFDGRLSLEWLRTDPESGNEVTKTAAAWFDSATRVVTLTTIFEEGAQGASAVRWTRSDALRLATADELTSWARAAGLEIEQLAGDHDLTPIGPGDERAILVARKPGD